MKTLLILFFVAGVIFSACKKEETASLVGKWSLDSLVQKTYVNNQLDGSYTENGDGITFDFQTTGNLVISYIGSSSDTVSYSIRGSNVEFNGGIYEIHGLTSTNVTLYNKEDSGGGTYNEAFFYLER
ncbi:MAG: hypothetical protein ICV66_00485 [Chitinophagaceae bacterium]|nr:hypothetical protein [Chitinophagaceae bacterium]